VLAIPLEGLTQQDGKAYVFSVNQKFNEGKATWIFEPIEVIVGLKNDRFAEVRTLMEFKKGQLFAQNSAYILMAELKKEEAEHSH
jgi:cobalt-zinc-cadmium efflux system membrane fusion protein